MPSLPHYQNAKASSRAFEPIYSNLFEVTITLPPSLGSAPLLIEHVNKIEGLTSDKGEATVEQLYKHAKRTYLAAKPEDTTTEPKIEFSLNLNDANELYVYKTLRDWWRLGYNPLTGEQGLKKDYQGSITIVNYNRKGEIFWQRTFEACIPTGDLPEFTNDYSGSEVWTMQATWKSDWFKETIV